MNARRVKKLGTACAGAALLTACAPAFNPAFEETSPLAPRVQAAVDANRVYPQWRDFPRSTRETPAPAQVAERVGGLQQSSAGLAADVAAVDWTVTEQAAAQLTRQAQAAAVPPSPDGFTSTEAVEALAQRLRERAKAPPPVDRRLPTP